MFSQVICQFFSGHVWPCSEFSHLWSCFANPNLWIPQQIKERNKENRRDYKGYKIFFLPWKSYLSGGRGSYNGGVGACTATCFSNLFNQIPDIQRMGSFCTILPLTSTTPTSCIESALATWNKGITVTCFRTSVDDRQLPIYWTKPNQV